MSEISESGSEISESTEVNEVPSAETGGEASEATQEAVMKEANETGGFEETDDVENLEYSDEDYGEPESDAEIDETQDIGFDDSDFDDENDIDDIEDTDLSDEDIDPHSDPGDEGKDGSLEDFDDVDENPEDPDLDEQMEEEEDPGEPEDYSDDDILEADDDTEIQDEDVEAETDAEENIDDAQEEGEEAREDQIEDPDTQVDENEAEVEADPEDLPEEDVEAEADAEGNLDDAQEEVEEAEADADESIDDDQEEVEEVEADAEGNLDDAQEEVEEAEADSEENIDDAQEETEETETDAEENIDDAQEETQENREDQIEDPDIQVDEDEEEVEADPEDLLEEDVEAEADAEENIDDDQGEVEEAEADADENIDDDQEEAEEVEADAEGNLDDAQEEVEEAEADSEENVDDAQEETEEAETDAEENIDDAQEEGEEVREDQIEDPEAQADENEAEVEADPEDLPEEDVEAEVDAEENIDDDQEEVEEAEADADEDIDDDQEEVEEAEADAVDQNVDLFQSPEDEYDQYGEYDEYDDYEEDRDEGEPEIYDEDEHRSALNSMAEYMSEHNYGRDNYAEYSKDSEWQKLNADLQQSLGMEVDGEKADTATAPESGKDISVTELPDNCVVINAADIDMTYARGMDSGEFWNHYGNTKEDYMRVAEKIPDVQQALESGKSLDEIRQDPELGETVRAYFDSDNMIKVEQQSDGSYSFTDDGRHRIAAAQEGGYQIPVEVTNRISAAERTSFDMQDVKELTPKEADAVRNITAPHFNRAREITQIATIETADGVKKDDMGANFTDHNEKHVEQVKEKTTEVLDASVAAIKKGQLEKPDAEGDVHFNDKVDYKVTQAAALAHDTGMSDDGYSIKCENKKPLKNEDGTFIIEKQSPENFNSVRDNHSANSALNVLLNREQYKAAGFTDSQVDEIAVLTYSHSKSNSGLGDLNNSGSWRECFDRIDAFVDKYNEDNPNASVSFDRTQFEGEQNKDRLGALATESLSLRIGDVSRDSGADATSQSGETVHVEKDTVNVDAESYQEEVKDAVVIRGDELITNEKSKQVHIGEQNIVDNHTEFKDGKMTHTITVNDGKYAPYCSAEAIKDHIGELASAKNGDFVVELQFDKPCDEKAKEKYEEFRDSLYKKSGNGNSPYENVQLWLPWDKE